jgi:hypothetical protein
VAGALCGVCTGSTEGDTEGAGVKEREGETSFGVVATVAFVAGATTGICEVAGVGVVRALTAGVGCATGVGVDLMPETSAGVRGVGAGVAVALDCGDAVN